MSARYTSSPEARPICAKKILEVIVTSVEEALAAEAGGADRLEIVSHLEKDGLTPALNTVREIAACVRIPVRAMVRETNRMCIADQAEVMRMKQCAAEFSQAGVEGLVLGYVRDGAIDQDTLREILSGAPQTSATFHRAFEHVRAPLAALQILKNFPQIDRVLVRASGEGTGIPLTEVRKWQAAASPEIQLIAGIGLTRSLLAEVASDPNLPEVHIGRWAREPENAGGVVSSTKVAEVKSALL